MHFTLGELLLDLVQNAANAGSRTVQINWREQGGRLSLTVSDDGCGMSPEVVDRAVDPFYTDGRSHPGRSIGLGLAFLRQTADAVDGSFRLHSRPGGGTIVGLDGPADHVDLPPAGDLVDTLVMVLCTEGPRQIEITRERNAESYTIRRTEMEDVLGDLSSVEGRLLLREYVRSQEEEHGKDDAG